MPLNGTLLGGMMSAECAANGLLGAYTPSFCTGFSNGLVNSFLATNMVTTVDVGVMAAGTGIGTITPLIPTALAGLALPQCVSAGAAGVNVPALVQAMSSSICTHFSLGIANTVHPLVALGSGVGTITGLIPSAMAAQIMGELSSNGIAGVNILPFVNAFCSAFCTFIMSTAIITVVITGVPAPLILGAPIPSAGSGTGKVS